MLIKKVKIPVTQMITVGLLPSFFKKIVYRFKGYKIGKNVSFGFGSVLIGEEVNIGDNSKIGFVTVVRAKKIKIGRFVKIGSMTMIDTEKVDIDDDARINEQVIIGGLKNPDSFIKIGKRAIIMEMSFINPTKPIIIGDDTGIGGHCLLFTHGSWLSQLEGYPVTFSPITLGKNVWLPWRVFILPGVTVGDNVVIGANSLVGKSIPSNTLIAGSPAKVLKENYPQPLSDERRKDVLNTIFSELEKHLTYHDFAVRKNSLRNDNFYLRVSDSKTASELFFLEEAEENVTPSASDNLLVIDYHDNNFTQFSKDFKMVINLKSKERIGSSDIGEEFASYISRYGIRCNRLD